MLRLEKVASPEESVFVGVAPERTPAPPCAVKEIVAPLIGLPPLSVTPHSDRRHDGSGSRTHGLLREDQSRSRATESWSGQSCRRTRRSPRRSPCRSLPPHWQRR